MWGKVVQITKLTETVSICFVGNNAKFGQPQENPARRQRWPMRAHMQLWAACGKIGSDAWHVNAGFAIIDVDVVVPAADDTTDFSVLRTQGTFH